MKASGGKIEFTTLLVAAGPAGGLSMPVPKEVSGALGTRSRLEVKGSLNGRPLRSVAMPDGHGGHTISVDKGLQGSAGVRVGDRVKVVLEMVDEQEVVEPPPDFLKAIQRNVQAKPVWEKFPPAQRRAYVAWIEEANNPDKRARRIVEAVQRIALGKAQS